MKQRGKTFLLLPLIIFLLILPARNLQSQKKETSQELKHKVTVTLKLIRVYVTDKEGHPVKDLKKDDFEIYDNGKLQPLTEFEKHVLTSPPSEAPSQEAKTKLPQKKKTEVRKYILFFDFAYNSAYGVRISKKAALHFIDHQLLPEDEVGVLSYSKYKGLKNHISLTNDHKKVRGTVEKFGLKDALQSVQELIDSELFPDPEVVQGFEKEWYKHQIKHFIEYIKALGKALIFEEGTKHIILFSEGILSGILTGGGGNLDFGDPALYKLYEEMLKVLAASNSSVFAIFTGGIDKLQGLGLEQLMRMADVTGGKWYGNIEFYEDIMEEIQETTGSYYVLGYYINEKWDGKYHNLEVKVKRKGCEVRTQGGYFNPKPFHEYSKLEKELHLLDLSTKEKPEDSEILSFSMEAHSCLHQGESSALLIAKLPAETAAPWLMKDEVEISHLVFDEEDNLVDSEEMKIDLSAHRGKNLYYYGLEPLKPGQYGMRVVLMNMKTGQAAIGSSQISIPGPPKSEGSGLWLDSPLLLAEAQNAIYIKNITKEEKKAKERKSGLLMVYPFDASVYSPLLGDAAKGTSRLFAVVRCLYFKINNPQVTISTTLTHLESEQEIGGKVSIFRRYTDKDSIISMLEIRTGELQPGNYELEFTATERVTGLGSNTTSIVFKVK